LFRPRRQVPRPGPIQSRRWLKGLGGAEQQGGGDQTNQSNISGGSETLRGFVPTGLQATLSLIITISV
jgi:hypothetical protein